MCIGVETQSRRSRYDLVGIAAAERRDRSGAGGKVQSAGGEVFAASAGVVQPGSAGCAYSESGKSQFRLPEVSVGTAGVGQRKECAVELQTFSAQREYMAS